MSKLDTLMGFSLADLERALAIKRGGQLRELRERVAVLAEKLDQIRLTIEQLEGKTATSTTMELQKRVPPAYDSGASGRKSVARKSGTKAAGTGRIETRGRKKSDTPREGTLPDLISKVLAGSNKAMNATEVAAGVAALDAKYANFDDLAHRVAMTMGSRKYFRRVKRGYYKLA